MEIFLSSIFPEKKGSESDFFQARVSFCKLEIYKYPDKRNM